jgi:4-cresol dehydrogenase (hydroxylating)
MVPMKGDEVEKVLDMVRSLYVKHGFDFTTALMVGNPRTVIALMSVFYDKNDPDESKRAAALYYEMGDVTQKAGYQQYRTSTMYMDRIFSNAPEFLSFCQKLKKAIDPQGIIAPGKYGIS